MIATLSNSSEVTVSKDASQPPPGSAVAVPNATCEAFVVLRGLVNVEQETRKLENKVKQARLQLDSLNKKIQNPDYKAKVPEAVQADDTARMATIQAEINNILRAVDNLKQLA